MTDTERQLTEAVSLLRAEVARLTDRLAALEERVVADEAGVTPEEMIVLSAAVAAFLGKKAPIRQIQLLNSPSWAQRGRLTIQASHQLGRRAGRQR